MKGGFCSFRIRRPTVGLSMKKRAGFTIVELVVALAIMGIAVSVAIPGFSRWLPDYRLKSAATELYTNLQLAKMSAVRDNAEWAVFFDPYSFKAYQIRKGKAPNGRYTEDPVTGFDSQKTILLSKYKGQVSFGHGNATSDLGGGWDDEITFGGTFPNTIIFRPRGMSDSEGYVYLQNEKNAAYAVGALTTGLTLMRKWTGTAWE